MYVHRIFSHTFDLIKFLLCLVMVWFVGLVFCQAAFPILLKLHLLNFRQLSKQFWKFQEWFCQGRIASIILCWYSSQTSWMVNYAKILCILDDVCKMLVVCVHLISFFLWYVLGDFFLAKQALKGIRLDLLHYYITCLAAVLIRY